MIVGVVVTCRIISVAGDKFQSGAVRGKIVNIINTDLRTAGSVDHEGAVGQYVEIIALGQTIVLEKVDRHPAVCAVDPPDLPGVVISQSYGELEYSVSVIVAQAPVGVLAEAMVIRRHLHIDEAVPYEVGVRVFIVFQEVLAVP